MPILVRVVLALVAAAIVGGGFMMFDRTRGAEWTVSPTEIAAAQADGKAGVETDRGSVTVLPIRSETADALPFKWALAGIGAGAVCFAATRRRTSRRGKAS
ncbi:hypothetical protein [Aureimonas pseudogalii]|uniref:Putative dienelactone hydrolase n=1 Tax=Aureimonas pseudogalii TaxID=1744844 RepID=A0A7W6H7T7_9HYPH|nr:hypothetical protein [Aureimonas pseudogalii]MBB4000204.1 putative dienelactone hydrolase [Aureimonas pseudogalii]